MMFWQPWFPVRVGRQEVGWLCVSSPRAYDIRKTSISSLVVMYTQTVVEVYTVDWTGDRGLEKGARQKRARAGMQCSIRASDKVAAGFR